MNNAEILFAALSTLLTGVYATLTYYLLKANRDAVAVMRDQAENLLRPFVTVNVTTAARSTVFTLRIANTGKMPATDLRLEIDCDFYSFAEKADHNNLANFSAFSKPIDCLAPGAELIFYLAHSPILFGPEHKAELTPLVFTVKASYCTGTKNFEESTTIDLRPYLNTAIKPDALIDELREVRKATREISRSIHDVAEKFLESWNEHAPMNSRVNGQG